MEEFVVKDIVREDFPEKWDTRENDGVDIELHGRKELGNEEISRNDDDARDYEEVRV